MSDITEFPKTEPYMKKEEPFINILKLHANALSCHCECLGMNAENCVAACAGSIAPYSHDAYIETIQKWGLIDKEGKPNV